MSLGALAAIGGGALGGFLDSRNAGKANDAARERLKAVMAMLGSLGGNQGAFGHTSRAYDEIDRLLGQSLGVARRGTRATLGELDMAGSEAIRQAKDIGSQRGASTNATMARRGLYNSSAATSALNQSDAMTSRQISSILQNLAGARAGAVSSGVGREMGALGSMAGSRQDRLNAEMRLLMEQVGLLSGVQDVPAPGFLQGIGGGQGLAALAGLF